MFETAASHIKENKKIGLGIIAEDELLGVSISYSDEDIYYIPAGGFITSDYLKDKLMILIKCSDNRNIVIKTIFTFLITIQMGITMTALKYQNRHLWI